MRTDRVMWYISWALQGSLPALAVILTLLHEETWVPACLISFFVALVPAMLRRSLRFTLPVWMILWITLSVWLHSLGGAFNLYGALPYFDHITHAVSASLVAAIGFMMVVILDVYIDSICLPRRFVSFFILMFGTTIGVFWEFLEFWTDQLTGAVMQYGLRDTVFDLMFDILASGVVALFLILYLRMTPEKELVDELGVEAARERIGSLIRRGQKIRRLSAEIIGGSAPPIRDRKESA